jgi:GTP-binding protein
MDIRNVAIIAHVDHGKTTLVDFMLKQTHTFRDNQAEMTQTTILDRNVLEREKGITILAKNTAVVYKQTKINIIDTPGHADFSGEVERVINMADGALLIVDAAEGPLPQTQFVLEQALKRNLKIIVIINKIDRKDGRPQEVLHETEELFLRLATEEKHLSFPVIYAVGREGKAWNYLPSDFNEPSDLLPLFEEIIKSIPAPQADPNASFKMLVSTLDFDTYKGTYAIGKISQGTVKPGQLVALYAADRKITNAKVEKVYTSSGLNRFEIERSEPGDIIAMTGISEVAIGYTIADLDVSSGFPLIEVSEPTLKIQVGPNTSPFAGREGKFSNARQLAARLEREIKTNIGLRIETMTGSSSFIISGKGELHLAILIENLRREGYEMEVGKPEVITKSVDGVTYEPFEEVTVEVAGQFTGVIIEEMGKRKGTMTDSVSTTHGTTKMVYTISSRNLLGFRSDMLTLTRGNGLFASRFLGFFPVTAQASKTRNGVLISLESGVSTGYALTTVQERGSAFIGPGIAVYEGMIIGLNRRLDDIEINVCRGKKLTNIHSANADIAIQLDPPIILTLEQCLDFIEEDELLEVTPENLRLRKKHLSHVDRVRFKRSNRN